jgi:hypothetical protein
MSGMTLGIVKDSEGRPEKPQLFDISDGEAEGKLSWVDLRLAKKEKADINSGSLINICHGEWCLDKLKEDTANQRDDDE